MDVGGLYGCIRCNFSGTQEQYDNHSCNVMKVKEKTHKDMMLDREAMRDDFMFLRGLIQGISFFSETSSMGDAMESVEEQLTSLSRAVLGVMFHVD